MISDCTSNIGLFLFEGISWSNFWQIDNKYSCRYLTIRTTIGLHRITFTARNCGLILFSFHKIIHEFLFDLFDTDQRIFNLEWP